MWVKCRSSKFLPGLVLGVCGVVLAADNHLPEAAFLEYLGSWEESDDEWMLFDTDDGQLAADAARGMDDKGMEDHGIDDERIDPVLPSEESTENDDES